MTFEKTLLLSLLLPACVVDGAPEWGDSSHEVLSAISHRTPAVARRGHVTLLAWATDAPDRRDVLALRLGGRGYSMDPEPIAIATTDHLEVGPAVAASDEQYLVVWNDRSAPRGLYGRRVDGDGAVLDEAPLAIGSGTTQAAALASDGRDFLAAWQGPSTAGGAAVNVARIDADGAVSASVSVGGSGANTPAVAFSGEQYLVAWTDTRTGQHGVYGQRFDQDGAAIGDEIAIAAPDESELWPTVVSSGDSFVVSWQHRDLDTGAGELRSVAIAHDGTIAAEPSAEPAAFVWGSPLAAATSGGHLVVASPELSADGQSRELRVHCGAMLPLAEALALDVAPAESASGGSPTFDDPRASAAASAEGTSIAWQRYEDGRWRVFVQALAADGTPQWADPVDPVDATENPRLPAPARARWR